MATFLIDTENVGCKWETLMSEVTGNTYLLFYTNPSISISYSLLEKILDSSSTTKCILCNKGTNALDFQLVSELGFRLAKQPEETYIIVSNDGGFDAAVKYWAEKGYSVTRQKIEMAGCNAAQPTPKAPQSNNQTPANKPAPNAPANPKPAQQQNEQPAKKKENKALAQPDISPLSGVNGIKNDEKVDIMRLCASVSVLPANKRLVTIINGLTQKYGAKHGREIYKNAMKEIKTIVK